MEDLSSISQTISDILKAPDPADESSFTQLLTQHLESPNSSVRHLVLEILKDVITEGTEDEIKARKSFMFTETVLTYIPILLPLHCDAPEIVESLVRACMEVCSPREAILALNEACQSLRERAQAIVSAEEDYSDAEMHDTDDEDEDMEPASSQLGDEGDMGELADEFSLVIKSYSQILDRSPGTKVNATLAGISDAISATLRNLIKGFTPNKAKSLAREISTMVFSGHVWVNGGEHFGSIKSQTLIELLFTAITILTPILQPQTMQKWFLAHFPRHGLMADIAKDSATSPEKIDESLLDVFGSFEATLTMLGIRTYQLAELIKATLKGSHTSPFAPFAAMTIIAFQLMRNDEGKKPGLGLPAMDDMMVLISAGLGGSAVDAAGTIAWDAVHRAEPGEIGFASPLIEILMPLATSDPDDLNRLIWFKLIHALIEKSPPGLDQILLLETLLEPANPYDTLRPQALTILRALLGSASRLLATSTSSPAPLTILQPALLSQLPLLPSIAHLAHPTSEFFSSYSCHFVTEQLMTLWLLYQVDKGNLTGARSEQWLGKIRASVEEVERKIVEVKADLGQEGVIIGLQEAFSDEGWLVLRLEDAVQRVKEVIE